MSLRSAIAAEAPATAAPPPVPARSGTPPPAAEAATPGSTRGGAAAVPGPSPDKPIAAALANPRGVAVDRAGNLYIVNYDDGAVFKITPAGNVTILVGASAPQALSGASGLTVDAADILYVAEADSHAIRKITPDGKMSVVPAAPAPPPASPGGAAAPAAKDQLTTPTGVAVDAAGNLYVSDNGNGAVRKITPQGVLLTFAGQVGQSGTADGPGAQARFAQPRGIAIDAAGNLYVADEGNSNIRKITPAGVVSTLAGKAGEPGQVDGTGTAATFSGPRTLTVNAAGVVYVADTDNNCIRQVTPAGVVTTLAGQDLNQPGITDGAGADARFAGPRGIAVDSAGNIYVADSDNNLIRRVTPAGVVTTVVAVSP